MHLCSQKLKFSYDIKKKQNIYKKKHKIYCLITIRITKEDFRSLKASEVLADL